MFYSVDENQRRRASSAHELAMVNLLLFNLLAGVALLAGSMAAVDSFIASNKWFLVAVPLTLSLLVMLFTWFRSALLRESAPWFVAVHWRLAGRRYRVLLIAYVASAAIVSFAFVGGGNSDEIEQRIGHLPPALQEMERRKLESQDMGSAIWARIGVLPLLVTVLGLLMAESGALYQARRGEVADATLKGFPPPAALPAQDRPLGAPEGQDQSA